MASLLTLMGLPISAPDYTTGFHAQTLEIFDAGRFRLHAANFGPWTGHLCQLSRKRMFGRRRLMACKPPDFRDGGSTTFPRTGLFGNVRGGNAPYSAHAEDVKNFEGLSVEPHHGQQ
jgi:hypothetical protein